MAYYIVEEHRNFGFFVHQEARLVRIQCKTGRVTKDGSCFEFSTVSVSAGKRGNLKKGYAGKAEYFAVYLPENGKVYMIAVNEAPRSSDMILRFKSAGVIRSNGRQNWRVSYEETIARDVKYNWAEDYEI